MRSTENLLKQYSRHSHKHLTTHFGKYGTPNKNEQQQFNIINNIAGQVKQFPFSSRLG